MTELTPVSVVNRYRFFTNCIEYRPELGFHSFKDGREVKTSFSRCKYRSIIKTVGLKQYFIHRKYIHVSTIHNGTESDSKQSAYM